MRVFFNLQTNTSESRYILTTNKVENQIAFKKYSFEKEINNPNISMFPITLKCVAEKFDNVWEFELTNSEINYLTTHESGLIFTSEKYLMDYVYEGFQSYEYDLQQHYFTQTQNK